MTPKYMKEIEKITEKLKGKSGIIEIYHEKDINEDLKNGGCKCEAKIRFIAKDNSQRMGMYGIRHIFKDRIVEPLDDLGKKYGAMVGIGKDGKKWYGNFPK